MKSLNQNPNMKSQQTLRHSTTQPLITTKSVNQPVTHDWQWLSWVITHFKSEIHHLCTETLLSLSFSFSFSFSPKQRDRDTTTSCHIRQYSHWQSTRGHHLPRRENHGGWCPVRERLTLAPIIDGHMITGDHWESQSVTMSYRLTSTGTVRHRLPERSSEEHGLSQRVHVTLGGEWHWMVILMVIGYRGWWISLGGC